jgi:hypothetical protein
MTLNHSYWAGNIGMAIHIYTILNYTMDGISKLIATNMPPN